MSDDFDSWLAKRPRWLQTAAAKAFRDPAFPRPDDFKALGDLCLAEARGIEADFEAAPTGMFAPGSSEDSLRLNRLKSVNGVNAMRKDASLDFGDASLCVVYGPNGSGKSGFARIVKHAAGAKTSRSVLPDVFGSSPEVPRAEIVYSKNGVETSAAWTASSAPIAELRHLHVFDTAAALSYVNDQNEPTYEPRRLRFITRLVEIADKVSSELRSRKDERARTVQAPSDLNSEAPLIFVQTMSADLSHDELRSKFPRAEDHERRRAELKRVLDAPALAATLADLDRRVGQISDLHGRLQGMAAALSDDGLDEWARKREAKHAARRAADEAAAVTFTKSALDGVGEDTWRRMWEAARSYSTLVAYKGVSFPKTDDALCVLCQQKLDDEAVRSRLLGFEEFVRGAVEQKAKEADGADRAHMETLPRLPAVEDWLQMFSGLTEAEEVAKSIHRAASETLHRMATAASRDEVSAVDFTPLLQLVSAHRAETDGERALLAAALKADERPKLQTELRFLRAVDWWHDNFKGILEELDRKKSLALLAAAERLSETTALTKKKGELAESEMTKAYRTRFEEERSALGAGHVRVALRDPKKTKGRLEYGVALSDARRDERIDAVLSEGESRIVALAAFIADMRGSDASYPLLFDDPISSLDCDFEQKVIERLVALARERQVIVFTHRLSLVVGIQEKLSEAANIQSLRSRWGRSGHTDTESCRTASCKTALNTLIEDRIRRAIRHRDAEDAAAYDAEIGNVATEFRIILERVVEDVLICGVVMRFRRDVQTKNKLSKLSRITPTDCALIESLMTKYSAFEHSISRELWPPIPEVDELRGDAVRLRNWVAEFTPRAVRVSTDAERSAS